MSRVVQILFERHIDKSTLKDFNSRHFKKDIDWHKELKLKNKGKLHLVSFMHKPDKVQLDHLHKLKKDPKLYFSSKLVEGEGRATLISIESHRETNRQSYIFCVPMDDDNIGFSDT